MSEYGTLSQIFRGVDKFDRYQERFDCRKEHVYIHVSSAKGFRNVTRILDWQEPPQPIYRQPLSRRAIFDRQGTSTIHELPSEQETPTDGESGNGESSERLHRSDRTSGNNDSPSGTGDSGAQEAKEGPE